MTPGHSAPARRVSYGDCPLWWACRYFSIEIHDAILRSVLEALCERDGIPLDSTADPGRPARNYELADRLRIGHVFGLPSVRCRVSKSGTCLKSVSAAITDHPACVSRCERAAERL